MTAASAARRSRAALPLCALVLAAVAALGLGRPATADAGYAYSTHTFTPCGASGASGPTLAQCLTAYGSAPWVSNVANFTVTAGIQYWTVPATGTYRITASGAKGVGANAGSGRVVAATVSLTEGDVLKVLVGQMGTGTGGGGGSFLTTNANAAIVVAGGGGGGGNAIAGGNGSDTASGGAGGAGGAGGTGTGAGTGSTGGGGGGLTGGASGAAFTAGGAGGGNGGFGGGGTGSGSAGGGGGGYAGGGGGGLVFTNAWGGGGGGGSFTRAGATDVVTTSLNAATGSITIASLAPAVSSFAARTAYATAPATLVWDLTMSGPVTGIDAADVTVGGTSSGWTVQSVTGSGAAYVVTLANAASPAPEGTVMPTLAADAATDASNRTGPAGAVAGGTATIDRTAPTATTFARATMTRSAATFTLQFSETVTGLAAADFATSGTSTGWTVSSVTGSGAGPYTVTLANATSGGAAAGTQILTLAANAVTDGINTAPASATAVTSTLGTLSNTVAPTISGTVASLQVLTCSPGTWVNEPAATGTAYQWQVSADGATGWANATGTGSATASYTVSAIDAARFLRCVVTQTNPYGTATANSAAAEVRTVPILVNSAASSNRQHVFLIGAGGRLTAHPTTAAVASGTTPYFNAATPDGRTVYAANSASNTVSQYRLAANGALTALSPATVAAGTTPFGIAVTPNGRWAYVVNYGASTVSQYAIGADGTLTPLATPTIATGSGPWTIAITPDGASAFVGNRLAGTISRYTIDATTGQLTSAGAATASAVLYDVKLSPNGQNLYVVNTAANTISQYAVGAGATLTPLTPATVATFANPHTLAVNAAGTRVYVSSDAANTVPRLQVFAIGAGGALTASGTYASLAGNGYWPTLAPDDSALYLGANTTNLWQFALDGSGVPSAMTPAWVTSGSLAAQSVVVTPPVTATTFTAPATPTSSTSPAYAITFTRPVTGLAANDFTVGGTATGFSVQSVTGSGAGPYTVTLGGAGPFTSGTITLALGANAVTDSYGATGPASAAWPINSAPTVTYDNVAPTVTSPAMAVTTRTAATYTVSFSEPVTGIAAADVTLAGTSTGWTVSSVTGSGSGPYVFTLANATAGGAPAGTLIPTVVLGAGLDAAGNQSVRSVGTATTLGAPVNAVVPSVTGTRKTGHTLAGANGTWTGQPTITYTYQWQVSADGSTGWASATGDGATTASYKAAAVDAWRYVRLAVTATNAFGSATGHSSAAAASALIKTSPVLYVQNAGASTVGIYHQLGNGQLTPISPAASATVAVASDPRTSVLSPDGRFLYVSSYAGSAISQFAVGQGGELTPLSPATVSASGVYKVAIAPSGTALYATGFGCSCVYQYTINANGTLAAKSPATVSAGAGMSSITVSPSGNALYASAENGNAVFQYAIGANGSLTALAPASVALTFPASIAVSANGQYAYVPMTTSSAIAQYSVGAGGHLTARTPATVALPANAGQIALSADGAYAFLTSSPGNVIHRLSIGGGGLLTALTPSTTATAPFGIALSPDGAFAYTATNTTAALQQFAVGAGGTVSVLSPATVTAGTSSQYPIMAVTPPAEVSYTAPPSTLYQSSGTYTLTVNRPLDPTTVTAADFTLGGTSTGWAIGTVTPVAGTNNTQFSIPISASSPTDGSITLDLNPNSVTDSEGVVGPGTGPSALAAPTIQYLRLPAVGAAAAGLQGSNVVSWTAPADTASITGWKVYWGTTSGSLANSVTLTGATSTSWQHTGLTFGTAYYYKVVATGPAGESAGVEVSATPGWMRTATYACASGAQTFAVPAGVTAVQVDAYGARGGQTAAAPSLGGLGGRVQGVLAVTPSTSLTLNVGCSTTATTGGLNGGATGASAAAGGAGAGTGAGGGGATDIRVGGSALANRVLVAGGGGGAGADNGAANLNHGGAGGGLTGGQGLSYNSPAYWGGFGGSQTAGGARGEWGGNLASAGAVGTGGAGMGNGGGGGGGFYGGGGGAYNGGGGGSSFAGSSVGAPTHTQGYGAPVDAAAVAAPTLAAAGPAISVTWGASTASGLTGYRLYRGTAPNPTTQIGGLIPAGTTAYTDSAVTSGTTYFYRVAAVTASGETAPSADATIRMNASTAATVVSIGAQHPSGVVLAGGTLGVRVNFTRAVTVTGAPRLLLQVGARQVYAAYAAGSGTTGLRFDYRMTELDQAAWVDVAGTSALELNGGTIRDAAAANAILTVPAPGSTTSLAAARTFTVPGGAGGYLTLTYPTTTFVTGVTATGLQGSAVVGWTPTDVANAAYYRIYGGTATNPTQVVGTAPIGANSFRHGGLAIGSTWYYRVSVVDTAGNETPKSSEASTSPTWTRTVGYGCTGTAQTFAVPAGVAAVQVDAYGARGGQSSTLTSVGGLGGRVQGVLPVTPSSTLTLNVGCSSTSATGGFNGGGAGTTTGSGGGGATDIRVGATGLGNRVWVAGGGGGAGADDGANNVNNGGAGGGLTGGQGQSFNSPAYWGGYGGSQTTGGARGEWAGTVGTAGAVGVGGAAAAGARGGGGGGGYYGGGGGGFNGGGGGSSYTAASAFDVTHTRGYVSTQDPSAPSGPVATASGANVVLTWNASSANGLTGYRVYRGTAPNPTTQIGTLVAAGTTTYTDATAVSGTTYFYRVAAVYVTSGVTNVSAPSVDATIQLGAANATVAGVSNWFPSGLLVAGTTFAARVNFTRAVTVTGAPRLLLQIGARQVYATYSSGTGTTGLVFSYTLTDLDQAAWIDVASTTALELNGGTIRDSAAANAVLTLPAPGSANSLSVARTYTVQANAGGYLSITYPTSAYVTNVVAAGFQGYAIVGWDPTLVSDAQYYNVYGGTTPNPTQLVGTVPIGLTSFRHTGLALGTTYYYRVTAVDGLGNETPRSNEAKAAPAFQTTSTFGCTGAAQTYVVPSGVAFALVDAIGARGGQAATPLSLGGLGGRTTGVLPVTPGATLNLNVGCTTATATGGFNGGGAGTTTGSGGGGATDIRVGGTTLANRVWVAGGGGGAGASDGGTNLNNGGVGGGLTGGQGLSYNSPAYVGGFGGSQTAGGARGEWAGNFGNAGASGVGGAGGAGQRGGGGGGGYFGGGGGAYNGGGGGSSYTAASAFDVTHTQGHAGATGNGSLVITTPATTFVTGVRAAGWQGWNSIDWDPTTVFDAVSFKVYGGTTPDPSTVIATLPIAQTEYAHTGLTLGTTYYYRISIIDSAGRETPKSAQVTAVPTTTAAIATFACTGAPQAWTAPGGLGFVYVDALGARGGQTTIPTSNAGRGGRVQAVLPVTAGTTYHAYVGCTTAGTTGGYNGGGAGASTGSGGGGATDLRTVGGTWNLAASLASRLVVAGGGGGAGAAQGAAVNHGGLGGGLTGGQGQAWNSSNATYYGGGGGTQTAGGAAGSYGGTMGSAGATGVGGASFGDGGGGGGGYFGGGGGAYNGGGGGASFTASGLFAATHTQGASAATGDGSLALIAPQSATPTVNRAVPGNGQVIVAWSASTTTDLVGYRVYRGTGPNPTTQIGTLIAAGTNQYVDATAVNGTTYHYRVKTVFLVNGVQTESDYSGSVSATPLAPGGSQTFACTGSAQTWTVPAGAQWIQVDAIGARGGQAATAPPATGGRGGRVQGFVSVTPAASVQVNVGCSPSTTTGGFGGGGAGTGTGSGGGGGSDLRVGGTALANRVLVAGGGGGAGAGDGGTNLNNGGVGGGLTGGQGQSYLMSSNPSYYGGFGGSQTAGGDRGGWPGSFGNAGASGVGGAGGAGLRGGGGGGGYFGGGGGAYNGGGGGSSWWATTSLVTASTQGDAAATGNGSITLSWFVDTTAPTVSDLTSTSVDGTYRVGAEIPVLVRFSEPVVVTGTPTLAVDAGTRTATVSYAGGSGTSELRFAYTVAAGDATAALDHASTTALALAGGTIRDASGNVAVLTLPAPGAAGSLAANRTLRIDAAPPATPLNLGIRGSGNAATLSWSPVADADVASYRLYKGTSAAPTTEYASVPAPGTSYTDRPLPRGITLCYRIVAVDTSGNASGFSADVCYTVPAGGPSEPTIFAAPQSASQKPLITGTSEAGTTITIYDFGVQLATGVAVAGDGSWSWRPATNLATGLHEYSAVATDGSSATSSQTPGVPQEILTNDTTPPTFSSVTTTLATGTYRAGTVVPVLLRFSEPMDVDLTTGTPRIALTGNRHATYASGIGTDTLRFTYTVQAGDTVPALDYLSTGALELNGGAITDLAGLAPSPAVAFPAPGAAGSLTDGRTITLDTTAPTVSTFTCPASTRTGTVDCVLTLSESVTGIATGAFTVGGTSPGWTVSAITGANAGPYTVTLTAPTAADGTLTVQLDGSLVADAAGNVLSGTPTPGTGAIAVDGTAPTVTAFTGPTPSPVAGTTLTWSVTFSEDVTGLTTADITTAGTATGWSVTQVTGSGSGPYTITLNGTAPVDGTLWPRIAIGAVADAVGNPAPIAVEAAAPITVDNTAPSAPTFTATSPTRASTLTYSLTLNEAVSGLTTSAFQIAGTATGWSVTALTGTGAGPYAVTLAGGGPGTVILRIPAATLTDAAGNVNALISATTVTVDRTAPTVTAFAPTATDSSADAVTFAITFSEPVTGLTVGKLSATGTSTTWTVASVTGSGAGPYTITATGAGSSEGTLGLRLALNAVADAAGNAGPAAAENATATVQIDRSAPTVTSFAATAASPASTTSLTFRLAFDGAVTGLAAGDLALSGTSTGWTVGTPVWNAGASAYDIPVTATSPTDGTVILTLAAGSVADAAANAGPAAARAATTITVDRAAPTITAFAPLTASPSRSGSAQFSVTFSEAVSGLATGDFSILTATGWTVDAVSGTGAGPYTVTVSSGAPADGPLGLRLAAGAAADAAGNTVPAANADAASTILIDVTPPSSTPAITSGPSGPIATATASFAFAGAGAGESYQCRLDAGAWAACTSPQAYSGLAEAAYAFEVRIVDAAGNGTAAAGRTFTVDTTAPTSTAVIATAPPDPDADPTPTFTFTGAGAGESYACRIDSGTWAACATPYTTSALAEGVHTLRVRTADAAGNAGGVAEHSWTVDLTAPASSPTITAAPADPSASASATFRFGGASGVETYECRIDAGAWSACTSPHTRSGLADGSRQFGVRLRDAAGNTGSPALVTWTVDTTAPTTTAAISTGPTGSVASRSATFTFTGAGAGEGYQCTVDGGGWVACTTPWLLTDLAEGSHSFSVRTADAAGNGGSAAARIWLVDTVAPTGTPVIGGTPADPTSQTTASLTLSGATGAEAYACSVDGAAFAVCTSPLALTGLAEGAHAVRVRLVDAAGNAGPTATAAWSVDTTEPAAPPTISGVPAGTTSSTSATATITGEAGTTFECRIDGAAWAACTSPLARTGLADGAHSLEARQVDAAGNAGPSASVVWTVDTAPPVAPAPGTLPGATSDTSSTFTFTGEPSSTFTCRIRSVTGPTAPHTTISTIADWAACSSPHVTPTLTSGTYAFDVRQTDGAGNVSPDLTSYWTIDANAPAAVAVTGIPASPTRATTAAPVLTLTANDPATSTTYGLECRIDGGAWQLVDGSNVTTCAVSGAPPAYTLSLTGLAEGDHSVAVRQVKKVGSSAPTTSEVTTVVWTVDRTAPAAPGIATRPADPTNQTSAAFTFSAEAGSTLQCRLDGGSWGACASPYAVAAGARTLDVRAVDAAGNESAVTTATWTVDLVAPGAAAVTGAPAAVTADASASISFTLTGDAVTTECRLDSGTWAACTSPYATGAIGEGSHTVQIRQIDAAGNVGSPTSVTWIVDRAAPASAPVIASGPSGFVTASRSTFAFLGATGDETYQCRLDAAGGGTWAACTASYTTPWLADGAHVLDVRLVDAAGNVGPTATRSWTIDTTAPASAPTMSAAPANPDADATPTFGFAGAGAGETYECRTDGGGWAPCTSPVTLGALGDGAHTFRVRIVDAAGNTGPEATTTWVVDTTAPTGTPTILSAPDAQTNQTGATLAFTGALNGETYACSLDGGAYAACTSPRAYSSLADGAHTFAVALVDQVGNRGAAASATWTVRTAGPATTPTVTPSQGGTTNDTTPSFALAGAGAGETFECRVDGGAWTTCTSPVTISPALAPGSHTFEARLVDAFGNRGSAASATVVVDTTPPAAPVPASTPADPTNATTATIPLGGEPGATFECRLDGGGWAPCASPVELTGLADGDHRLEVRQIDVAGNVGAAQAIEWTVDTAPPTPAPVIAGTPVSPASTSAATLSFTASEAGSTFECSIDGAAFAPCATPLALSGLTEGGHVVKVREIDAVGNVGAASTASWIVDTTPPAPPASVTGTPVGVTRSTTATATITGDAGNGFQCKLDFGGWASCTSPHTVSGLADGEHTLSVRQIDAAGNAGPAIARRWTVDATAPAAAPLTGTPPAMTSNPQPVFTFTGEGGTTFECTLDGTTWTPCTSPVQVSPALADGAYTFQTRQIDAAGNVGPASSFAFTVSATAPAEVQVDNIPSSPTGETTADLLLTETAGMTLECSVDGGAWQRPCASPLSLSGLAEGAHEVIVRQVNTAVSPEVTSAETAVRWEVDLTPPAAPAISGRPDQPTQATSAAFDVAVSPGTTVECRVTPGSAWAPCTPPVEYTPLADGAYVFETRAIDAAGNVGATSSVAWTVDTLPPTGSAVIASAPAALTDSSVATFAFSYGADGATAVCSVDDGPYVPCRTPYTIPTVGEGQHVFRVKPVDAAGNVGANVTTHIWDVFVPTTPPPGPVGVRIAGGAAWVQASDVVVDIIWPAGARFVEFDNDPAFGAPQRHSITTQLSWTLLPGVGARTVHVRFLDATAAVMTAVQDDVGVDPTPPSVVAIASAWTGAAQLEVTPTLADAVSGIAGWQATTDTARPGAVLPASQASARIEAAAAATVFVRAIDAAGNVSAWVSQAAPDRPVAAGGAVAGANTVVIATNATASTAARVGAGGGANLELGCTDGSGAACEIRIAVRYERRVIATVRQRVRSGAVSTVGLRLPRDVQQRLAEDGDLALRMQVQATTSAGEETKDAPLDLTAPRALTVASVAPDPVATGSRSATIGIRCAGTIPYHCAGPVELVLLPEGRRGVRASDPVVGTGRVKGAAGARLPVRVTLNAKGRALLAKRGTLRVVARMTVPETEAIRVSSAFVFRTIGKDDWLRRVIAEMQQAAPARVRLNNVLDQYAAGQLTAAETARIVEQETLARREATLQRLRLYENPPRGLERAGVLLLQAYRQSVVANEAILAWLKAGGDRGGYPWRPSAEASRIKEELIAVLVREAAAYRIPVPPATSLYP